MSDGDRNFLEEHYFTLAKRLEERYSNRNFKNHCYWRIALDQVFGKKWDTAVAKPAYKNLKIEDLKVTVTLLTRYLEDENLLLQHNQTSLQFRR
ncbi:MAG: hypothetical protein ACI9DK_001994 [Vicingaceae bacterium]|jgi:hypothetical protein